jgi:hypothetical protein
VTWPAEKFVACLRVFLVLWLLLRSEASAGRSIRSDCYVPERAEAIAIVHAVHVSCETLYRRLRANEQFRMLHVLLRLSVLVFKHILL